MLGNNKPSLSQLREQVKNSDKYNLNSTSHNQPSDSFRTQRTFAQPKQPKLTTPINNNFKAKLAIGGGLLGAGALGAAALGAKNQVTGEAGSHFHDAFSNISGVHENEGMGASVGTTVASSSAPMVATGGKSILLKDAPILPKMELNRFKRKK